MPCGHGSRNTLLVCGQTSETLGSGLVSTLSTLESEGFPNLPMATGSALSLEDVKGVTCDFGFALVAVATSSQCLKLHHCVRDAKDCKYPSLQ